MRAEWQESLLNARGMIEPIKTDLRFGLSWVPISSLAEQFYCEAKVDFEYKFGRVPTPAKEEGTKLHDDIIEMEPTTPKDLVRSITRQPTCLCTFPVYARIEDIAILGIPDAVLFKRSRPSHLIELKTTSGDVGRLWRDQAVQVKAYGLALEFMGFKCESLQLALIRVNKQGVSDELKERLISETAEAFLKGDVGKAETWLNGRLGGQVKIHLMGYDRADVLRDVMWAKDYWLKKREAIPTTNPSKCRACEFSEACPFSLIRHPGMKHKVHQQGPHHEADQGRGDSLAHPPSCGHQPISPP